MGSAPDGSRPGGANGPLVQEPGSFRTPEDARCGCLARETCRGVAGHHFERIGHFHPGENSGTYADFEPRQHVARQLRERRVARSHHDHQVPLAHLRSDALDQRLTRRRELHRRTPAPGPRPNTIINPGNVGVGGKHDENFRRMIEVAVEHGKPVRIGVNWGSLDRALLTALMDANAKRPEPRPDHEVMLEAIRESALRSAELAERCGLPHDRIVLSAKVSEVGDLVAIYRALGAACDYPLHLGLTEAGPGMKGIVASAAALSILLA